MRTRIFGFETRQVGVFMSIVYIWLSAVVQLCHTDDLRAFAPIGSPSRSATELDKYQPTPPDQPCLAHEWSGAVHSAIAASAAVALVSQPQAELRETLRQVLHLQCFDHNPQRGPPTLFS